MQDKELYQQILGLDSPWSVDDVEIDHDDAEIRVHVTHPRGTKFCCPECQTSLPCHDHTSERRWRHLDSCQFKTILTARVPWANKHCRFTLLFERLAIDVLLSTQTVQGAKQSPAADWSGRNEARAALTNTLRTKWDQTWGIIERAVARGKNRKLDKALPRIGIDEKAFKKGHSYITMIYDLNNSTVETF